MKNTFIWTDLSTFDIGSAKDFYGKVFGWNFEKMGGYSGSEDYWVGHQRSDACAAVFVMPDFLQKLNLPSFWMSYIWVDDVEEAVEKARSHQGVVIEVEPTNFGESSKIALIRDPSGAGFTAYEGPDLAGRYGDGHGKCVWNVHHVNDLGLIKSFYEDVFDWKFASGGKDVYKITNGSDHIADVEVLPDDLKGNFQYWMPIFSVQNTSEFSTQVEKSGGKEYWDLGDGRVMYQDPQGATFLTIASSLSSEPVSMKSSFKWKTLLALAVILVSLWYDFANVVFGLLFLLWTVGEARTGKMFIVEEVSRKTNPILFWFITVLYILLSVAVIIWA